MNFLKKIPPKVYVKYSLLQIPALVLLIIILLVLKEFLDFSGTVIVVIAALWAAKDIAMFPFLWKSYDSSGNDAVEKMIGMIGVVQRELNPEGYIRIGHELWMAELMGEDSFAEKGEAVVVVDVVGLKLIVES